MFISWVCSYLTYMCTCVAKLDKESWFDVSITNCSWNARYQNKYIFYNSAETPALNEILCYCWSLNRNRLGKRWKRWIESLSTLSLNIAFHGKSNYLFWLFPVFTAILWFLIVKIIIHCWRKICWMKVVNFLIESADFLFF